MVRCTAVPYDTKKLADASFSRQFRRPGLTAFQGRAHELGTLQRTLEEIATGTFKAIGISGVPGSGTSRLCYEFVEWCRARRVPVFEVRTQPYGHATPLQLVLAILRLLLGVSPNDDAAAARQRIALEFLPLAPTFGTDLSLLHEFLGIAEDDSLPAMLHPKARQTRLFDLMRQIVRHRGAATSVILIEDVHWLDTASRDFIETLIDAVADAHAMLVVSYDPGHKAAWMRLRHFRELALPKLAAEDAEALVTDLIGAGPALGEVREQIVERSGGNPFFIEELVHVLADRGEIYGQASDCQRGVPIGETPLPDTVEGAIGARIDRLDEGTKSLLQIAAVIGTEFTLPVLQQVAGQSLGQVTVTLVRLCKTGLIEEQPTTEHRQFSFRHSLIQDVAYATQLTAKRKQLHAAVAKAMQVFYGDRLDEHAGLLAYHYEAAGQPLDAAHYAARNARWVGSFSREQATHHWQKVRLLLDDQPRSPARDSLWIMANAKIAWLGFRGEGMSGEAAREFIHEGLKLARDRNDPMLPMLLLVDGRMILATGGSTDTYVAHIEEALALTYKAGNLGRIATISCALSQAYGWAGLLNRALVANEAALEHLPHIAKADHEFLGYNIEHWALTLRARILVHLARFAEAKDCLRVLLQDRARLVDPSVQFIPHLVHVELAWCQRDSVMAQEHAAQAVEISEKSGIPYLYVYALFCLGTARILAGDFAGGARELGAAVEVMRDNPFMPEIEPQILCGLAECHLSLNDPDRAAAIASKAVELAQRRGTRVAEIRASMGLASALLAQYGQLRQREADQLFEHADQLIGVTGAKIYEPLLARARSEAARVASMAAR